MDKSMENKLNDMKLSSEENLKSLDEKRQIAQKLLKECMNLKQRSMEHIVNLKLLKEKKEVLLQNYDDVVKRYSDLKTHYAQNLENQEIAVKDSEIDDADEKLQNLCCLLGYQFTNYEYQDQFLVFRLHYNAACYVELVWNDDVYKLHCIVPTPSQFNDIQEFFYTTQDLQGLLINLRKYFAKHSS